MAYAGDVVFRGRRLQGDEIFTSLGMEMNKKKKTKFLIVSRKPYNENEFVKLGTNNFEIVKDCTHVGKILTIKIKTRY
jgi:hypothetical protein